MTIPPVLVPGTIQNPRAVIYYGSSLALRDRLYTSGRLYNRMSVLENGMLLCRDHNVMHERNDFFIHPRVSSFTWEEWRMLTDVSALVPRTHPLGAKPRGNVAEEGRLWTSWAVAKAAQGDARSTRGVGDRAADGRLGAGLSWICE